MMPRMRANCQDRYLVVCCPRAPGRRRRRDAVTAAPDGRAPQAGPSRNNGGNPEVPCHWRFPSRGKACGVPLERWRHRQPICCSGPARGRVKRGRSFRAALCEQAAAASKHRAGTAGSFGQNRAKQDLQQRHRRTTLVGVPIGRWGRSAWPDARDGLGHRAPLCRSAPEPEAPSDERRTKRGLPA
jgi:hypothetical protein